MTPNYSPAKPRWLHRITAVTILALLILLGCDNSAILAPLPGSQWQLVDTTLSSMSFEQIAVSAHSNGSRTLYAGPIGGDLSKESFFLIRPALIDSFRLANFISAELVLFRRMFRDSTTDPSSLFEMSAIIADSIIWSESDTGLTADMPGLRVRVGAVQASMTTADITVPVGDSTEVLVDVEHIKFPLLAETFSNWLVDSTALNGYVVSQISGTDAGAFHSRSSVRPPQIAVTYMDTANGGEVATAYLVVGANLGIYPPSDEPLPNVTTSTLMMLNYHNGWGVHLNFSPSIIPDSSRRIITARLKFISPQAPEDIIATTVTLRIERRIFEDSLATAILFPGRDYYGNDGAWTVFIGNFASGINNKEVQNFGIDLRIIPTNHDFDTLIFYSPYADQALRPTLELVYGTFNEDGG